MRKMRFLLVALCFAAALAAPGMAAPDGNMSVAAWAQEKCARYSKAWDAIAPGFGIERLGDAFVTNHAAFLESDCTLPANVCPRSAAELEMANLLSLAALNAGMTGSFVPFACRD